MTTTQGLVGLNDWHSSRATLPSRTSEPPPTSRPAHEPEDEADVLTGRARAADPAGNPAFVDRVQVWQARSDR